ncbi:MAG: division/cell wall cluster transcriptional repressor MraZ [Sneathiella sp.]|nr:MAG: division/cell wall cluster transcriptional repressor MraZ [Sneathiella sp.]
MALFLSTYVNKVDKKGRVSVPSRFRSVLVDKGFETVVLFPTINGDAIDACGMDVMENLLEKIGGFDPLSEDRESYADVLMSDAIELAVDGDGRIMIPLDMLIDADIKAGGQCAFVGRGDSFQIWNPDAFAARKKLAQERTRSRRAAGAGSNGGSDDE